MDETGAWLEITEIDESTEGIGCIGLNVNGLLPLVEVTAADEIACGG